MAKSYEQTLRTYRHLTDDELRQEIIDRKRSRYSTRKVGTADCMVDIEVIRACQQILQERQVANNG